MPITGEVMRMPFQSTWVCSGAVPRNEAVASVPRPYCLMKTVELCDRMSAIDRRDALVQHRRVDLGALDADLLHGAAQGADRHFADRDRAHGVVGCGGGGCGEEQRREGRISLFMMVSNRKRPE